MKTMPHPEAREGEVYIANVNLNEFATLGLRTKRIGIVPLHWVGPNKGYALPASSASSAIAGDIFPLFVMRVELEERAIEINDEEPFEPSDIGSSWAFFLEMDYDRPNDDLLFEELYKIAQVGVVPWIVQFEQIEETSNTERGHIGYDIAIREDDVARATNVHRSVYDIVVIIDQIADMGDPYTARATKNDTITGKYSANRRKIINMVKADRDKILEEGNLRERAWKDIAQDEFESHLVERWTFQGDVVISEHPFFTKLGALVLDAGNRGKWVFFRNQDDADDAATQFTYHRLETDPNHFEDEFILRHIDEDSWGNYVVNQASTYCSDMSIADLMDIGWINQEEYQHADDDEKERMDDKARERCFESEIEMINENGIAFYFGGDSDWKKRAMEALNFKYDRAVDDYTRGMNTEDLLSALDSIELDYPVGVVGYRI